MLSSIDLRDQIKSLGVEEGDLLNLKISYKSIGKVDGGPRTVIATILDVIGPEGTIISESFVQSYPKFFYWNRRKKLSTISSPTYAGAIAANMLKMPNSFRSSHPIQKFVGIGRLAKPLMEQHTANSNPYGVLKEMINLGGKNLRIGSRDKVVGVGTTHVAIEELGLRQKRLPIGVYYENDEHFIEFFKVQWASGCSRAFNNLIDFYKQCDAVIGDGYIGEAESLLTSMRKTFDIEYQLFKKDLAMTLCGDPKCIRCRIAWEHGDHLYFDVFRQNLLKADFRALMQLITYAFVRKYSSTGNS